MWALFTNTGGVTTVAVFTGSQPTCQGTPLTNYTSPLNQCTMQSSQPPVYTLFTCLQFTPSVSPSPSPSPSFPIWNCGLITVKYYADSSNCDTAPVVCTWCPLRAHLPARAPISLRLQCPPPRDDCLACDCRRRPYSISALCLAAPQSTFWASRLRYGTHWRAHPSCPASPFTAMVTSVAFSRPKSPSPRPLGWISAPLARVWVPPATS